jgi:peroxiredoxin
MGSVPDDLTSRPSGLPAPEDDGAASHLPGATVPDIALASTGGRRVSLATAERPTLVFAFPWAGRPGEPLPADGWDAIPGARGCTAEACGFRDLHAELRGLGLDLVGLSVQDPARQAEIAERLRLRFPLLSDEGGVLAAAMRLPTLAAGDAVLLRRLTMLLRAGVVERIWSPVFPPDRHAERVLADLTSSG